MIHPETTYKIRGCIFDVYNQLGPLWREEVFEEASLASLTSKGLKVDQQKEFEVYYKEKRVGLYRTDLIVNDEIILELKATSEIIPLNEAQIISYLKVTSMPLGMLINFGSSELYIKGYPNLITNKKALNINFDFDSINLENDIKNKIQPHLLITKEIQEELGPGFFHRVYRRAFWHELAWHNINFRVVHEIKAMYNGIEFGQKSAKFFIIDDLLISIIAVKEIDDLVIKKFSHHVKYFNCNLGLIINFNNVIVDFRVWIKKQGK